MTDSYIQIRGNAAIFHRFYWKSDSKTHFASLDFHQKLPQYQQHSWDKFQIKKIQGQRSNFLDIFILVSINYAKKKGSHFLCSLNETDFTSCAEMQQQFNALLNLIWWKFSFCESDLTWVSRYLAPNRNRTQDRRYAQFLVYKM